MQDRILIKHNGKYIALLELMKLYDKITLVYHPNANHIQAWAEDGTYIGNLKHDFTFGDPSCR